MQWGPCDRRLDYRGLLRDLTARREHPAVISFGEDGVVTWGSETLAEEALGLARGVREVRVRKLLT